MGSITLITGGVRSGKSAYALSCTEQCHDIKAFIATAVPFDNEMAERIKNHQIERGNSFLTIEEPYDLAKAILELNSSIKIAIVDCLTVWLGNLFYKYENDLELINKSIDEFIRCLSKSHADLYLVTNEVGWGIVPDNKLSRCFRDLNGLMNQKIALLAKIVILCACGIPIKMKG
jgi:adenosylcobinamide kinase / adenosylcobinamide-phosphate guanylyltransferase